PAVKHAAVELPEVVAKPAPEPDPTLALAFAPPDPLAGPMRDADITGSLGNAVAKPAQADIPMPAPGAASVPLPQPRPRVKLASLTAPDVPMAKPDTNVPLMRTAIYDITARVVYLPNGERLEAHSGLGQLMDDPRYVHRRMVGATPPGTYKLTLREA